MGAVKAWGMERVEARTQELYAQGMSWAAAAETAHDEIFGPEDSRMYIDPPEPTTTES